jgi:pyruvate dehydrogenase E2 component (dihydrolipoamide acetyltransferase)
VLFEIETDKAAMEIEAEDSGYLHHRVPEGTDVPIGKPVAWLYAEGEAVEVASRQVSAASTDTMPQPKAIFEARARQTIGSHAVDDKLSTRTRATPRARALARNEDLDIALVPGTGPRGRVQGRDIEGFLERRNSTPAVPSGYAAETGPLAVTRSNGGSGTPVVLIHGFASDALSWAPLEPSLKHRPIIRIDLPSHGRSPKLAIDGFAGLAAEIRRCFDELGCDRAHLVGHSLGGALALALADTRERRVASLTLIAPAGLGPEINGAVLSGICAATRPESLGPWLRTLVADETLITDSYVRLAMAQRAAPAMRAAQASLADVLFPDGVQAFDLRQALDRVSVPARIIWGKRDSMTPWRHALAAPGSVALHLFDRVGHVPQLEIPKEVGNLIAAWL